MDIPCERKKLNDVLDGINNTGNISFDEFKEFVKKAQATDSDSRYLILLHFTVYSFTIDVEEDCCLGRISWSTTSMWWRRGRRSWDGRHPGFLPPSPSYSWCSSLSTGSPVELLWSTFNSTRKTWYNVNCTKSLKIQGLHIDNSLGLPDVQHAPCWSWSPVLQSYSTAGNWSRSWNGSRHHQRDHPLLLRGKDL